MIEIDNYSFKVEINELTSSNVLLTINLDKVLDESIYWKINSYIAFQLVESWLNFSFYGGYKERIDRFHYHTPRPRKTSKVDITMQISPHNLVPALHNLFILLENGFNNNPEFNQITRIDKVTVKSIDCFFLNYEHGRR